MNGNDNNTFNLELAAFQCDNLSDVYTYRVILYFHMVTEGSSKRTYDPWDKSIVMLQSKMPGVITHDSVVISLCLIKLSHTTSAVDVFYALFNRIGNRGRVRDPHAVNHGQCFCCYQCRYTYYIM